MVKHRIAHLVSCTLVLLLALALSPDLQAGPPEEIAAAEYLVKQTWIEGLPYDQARALSDAGIARLAEILADPGELQWHANAITALGMSGHRDAFEALGVFANRTHSREVDRDTYRALNALPFAMGHLARVEPRALARLEAALADSELPTWQYKHLSGSRLRDQIQTSCITGLGLAGRADLVRAHRSKTKRNATKRNSPREQNLLEAEALAERIDREGPDSVFQRVGRGMPRK
ncbi:MAG: hypothetical protein GY725_01505 [bacterium]|nr:hypothetical protein [bacterium]